MQSGGSGNATRLPVFWSRSDTVYQSEGNGLVPIRPRSNSAWTAGRVSAATAATWHETASARITANAPEIVVAAPQRIFRILRLQSGRAWPCPRSYDRGAAEVLWRRLKFSCRVLHNSSTL